MSYDFTFIMVKPKYVTRDSEEEGEMDTDSKDSDDLSDSSDDSNSSEEEEEQPQADMLGPHSSSEALEAFYNKKRAGMKETTCVLHNKTLNLHFKTM